MTQKDLQRTWDVLRSAYRGTVVYGRFGVQGSPENTLRLCLTHCTKEDLRAALGIVAHMKRHDGRFSNSIRSWLYAGVSPAITAEDTWASDAWTLIGVDDIHSTHLDNLSSYLRSVYDNLSGPYKDGKAFVEDMHQQYGLSEAFRMAHDYVTMQEKALRIHPDPDEERFVAEVKEAMAALDTI